MAIRKYGFRKRRIVRRKVVPRRRLFRKRGRRLPRMLVRKPEVKTATTCSNVTAFNQGITGSDVLPLFPSISQGTSGVARIGDKIALSSGSIRGVITMDGGDYSTLSNTRIGVRVIILRMKRYMNWNDANAAFSSYYTNLIEGSVTGFTGDIPSFTSPVNRDMFSVIKDKKFYLTRSQITVGGAAVELGRSYASFNWKLPYQKRNIQFNAGEATPQNYPYFMVLGYTKLDGSTPDGSTTTNIELQYTTTFKFTDY